MVSASVILLIIRCVALFDGSSCLYKQATKAYLVLSILYSATFDVKQ